MKKMVCPRSVVACHGISASILSTAPLAWARAPALTTVVEPREHEAHSPRHSSASRRQVCRCAGVRVRAGVQVCKAALPHRTRAEKSKNAGVGSSACYQSDPTCTPPPEAGGATSKGTCRTGLSDPMCMLSRSSGQMK